jgi:hypothetical protein
MGLEESWASREDGSAIFWGVVGGNGRVDEGQEGR